MKVNNVREVEVEVEVECGIRLVCMRDLFNLSRTAVDVLRKRIEMAENGILFFETRGRVDNRDREVLDTLPHIKRFRVYDLRHTFATRQVQSGTDSPTLATLVGHANIKETMRSHTLAIYTNRRRWVEWTK